MTLLDVIPSLRASLPPKPAGPSCGQRPRGDPGGRHRPAQRSRSSSAHPWTRRRADTLPPVPGGVGRSRGRLRGEGAHLPRRAAVDRAGGSGPARLLSRPARRRGRGRLPRRPDGDAKTPPPTCGTHSATASAPSSSSLPPTSPAWPRSRGVARRCCRACFPALAPTRPPVSPPGRTPTASAYRPAPSPGCCGASPTSRARPGRPRLLPRLPGRPLRRVRARDRPAGGTRRIPLREINLGGGHAGPAPRPSSRSRPS
jgi:hypothetical protein